MLVYILPYVLMQCINVYTNAYTLMYIKEQYTSIYIDVVPQCIHWCNKLAYVLM